MIYKFNNQHQINKLDCHLCNAFKIQKNNKDKILW